MKVYIVKFDWSTTDCGDVDFFVYDSYDKAYDKFKAVIADELNPDNSWVGDLEWIDGKPQGHYEFKYNDNSDCSEVYWRVTDEWDYYRHSFVELLIMEVK